MKQPTTNHHQPTTKNYPLIIFAGGKSSRMGRDKALLPFGGYPTLTEYQIARFTPYFKKIYVGCKSKKKFDFEANFIEDLPQYEESAPHIGLISAFEQLHEETICVLSVDTPFFSHEDFKTLLAYLTPEADAVVAQSPGGDQPLCALYRRTALPHLKALTEAKRYRFRDLYDRIETIFVPFDDERSFTNLNTPQEYARVVL
jgi:molybdopterin-guanine dinucleotide biosynthesis protein A